ncbi:hypothetical protein BDZ89DRAFT_1144752 [Hymenopellis radicata]|nr:hypothetical protein BDZ89DRAFT_1144752 [Hymenopellis radicata]
MSPHQYASSEDALSSPPARELIRTRLAVSSLWTVAMTTLPSYECARLEKRSWDVLQDQTDTAPSPSSSLYNHHHPSPPPSSPLFSLNERVDRNSDRDTYRATHSTIWWGELELWMDEEFSIPQHGTTLSSAEHPSASKRIIFLPTTKKTQLLATFLRNLHSKAFAQPDGLEDSSVEQVRAANTPSIPHHFRRSARGVDYPNLTPVVPGREQMDRAVGVLFLCLSRQLMDISLKTYTTKQLDDSVGQLAAKPDENVRQHCDWEAYQRPVQPLVEIKALTRRIGGGPAGRV